jgi:hypothetical protein
MLVPQRRWSDNSGGALVDPADCCWGPAGRNLPSPTALAAPRQRLRIGPLRCPSKEAEITDFGLFIGFGPPIRGRERQALAVFNEAMQYWTRLQQQGEIESFESVFLEPHGGDLSGFTLVRGDRDKLASIRTSDEFARLTIRAGLITEGFGVVGATLGERIGTLMGVYNEQMDELT